MQNCLNPHEDTFDSSELAKMVSFTEPTVPDEKIVDTESKNTKLDKKTPTLTDHSNYKVAVAIDFGTDGSGICYAFPDGDVRFHNQFKSSKFGSFAKHKTHILLDEDGDFHSFGLDASYSYMTLPSKKQKKYALFQNFKMNLYNRKDRKMKKQQNRKAKIKKLLSSFNGHLEIPAEKVFVEALKHLKKEAMKYLKKMKKIKKISFKSNDIKWILTVPAIWDETAKHQMRDWAKKAGLIAAYSQCSIVLEPDCASLAVQHFVLNKKNIKQDTNVVGTNNPTDIMDNEESKSMDDTVIKDNYDFKKGDKYILIDVGGGTADIACHEILTENDIYGVKEIYHPSGGAFGASYIDDEFINMLGKIFSKQWMDEFKMEYANHFVELVHKFRIAKETYYRKDDENNTSKYDNLHYIELPEDFVGFLDEKCETLDDEQLSLKYEDNDIEPEDMFENAQINGKKELLTLVRPQGMDDNKYYLAAHNIVWKYLFDTIVIKIIDDCRSILSHQNLNQCKYMILVGGLACNQYYIQRMNDTFGDKLKIIVPPNPILAVVEGAARFAYNESYIKARVLSKHYGISASYSLKACESVNVDKDFIEKNKFERSKGDWWVDNLFYPLAIKNQTVYLNKAIYYTLMRRTNKCKKINLQLYECDEENVPFYIDQCKKFASINPQILMDFKNKKNMDLMIKLIFGDSILRVYVYPKISDYAESFAEKELELEYQHY